MPLATLHVDDVAVFGKSAPRYRSYSEMCFTRRKKRSFFGKCLCRRSQGLRHLRPRPQQRGAQAKDWQAPWAITFDLRERETEWTAENQARLVKLFAAEKLDIDPLEAEQRVAQLCVLVPKLSSRIKTMEVALLAKLLKDLPSVAGRMANLRDALDVVDVGNLAALAPQVLLEDDQKIVNSIQQVADLLSIDFDAAQEIVNSHPRFLDVELVREVLEELHRLMPDRDASKVLQREPTWLLRVERGPKRLGPHPDDI